MRQISGIHSFPPTVQKFTGSAGPKAARNTEISANPKPAGTPAVRAEFSDAWTDKNWQDLAQQTLDHLKDLYPSVNIVTGSAGGSVQDLAAALGPGIHLVISEEFLKRMCSSEDEFKKCSAVLTDMAKRLSSQAGKTLASGAFLGEKSASLWSVKVPSQQEKKDDLLKMPDLPFSISKQEKNVGKRFVSSASFQVSRYYSKVAAAKSKGQVQSAVSDIHRCIANLRSASVSGDDKTRVKARRALRSLNKLLGRSGRKIKQLNQEDLARLRQKRAEKEMEERRAEYARAERDRLRSQQKRSDYILMREGKSDEAYIRNYQGYRSAKRLYQEAMPPAPITLPAAMPVDMATGGAAFTAADVVVSETVTF